MRIFKKNYIYFVSFYGELDGRNGYGNFIIDSSKKIKKSEQLDLITHEVIENSNFDHVTILNFKLL